MQFIGPKHHVPQYISCSPTPPPGEDFVPAEVICERNAADISKSCCYRRNIHHFNANLDSLSKEMYRTDRLSTVSVNG